MTQNVKTHAWVGVLFVLGLPLLVTAGEVDCQGFEPIVFPKFDGTCQDGRDCRSAIHQINCCGTRHALGINYLEEDRFARAETTCRAQFPPCRCADHGIFTDEGTVTFESSQILVTCSEGVCVTFLSPD